MEKREHQVIREPMDISQGKLVMAVNGRVTQNSDLYPALILYNGILGGFPTPSFFQMCGSSEDLLITYQA